MKKLDAKEKIFVAEYLIDLNPERAAVKAGYSKTMGRTKAYQWVSSGKQKPHVYAAIQERLEKKISMLDIKADNVLRRIAQLGYYDARRFFDAKGNMKEIHELDEDTAAAVTGFDFVTLYEGSGENKHAFGRLNKLKLADKGANLERLGKHLKLFTEVHEHELSPTSIGLQQLSQRLGLDRLTDEELAEFRARIKAD